MKVCRHNINGWCNVRAVSLGHSKISPCDKCPLGMELTIIDNSTKQIQSEILIGMKGETKMKVSEIKQKVAAKVAKGKAKVAKKCGKAKACAVWLIATASLAFIVGCQSPAQRAQTAETTQNFYIYEGATATFTFGSEFVSLAQSNETGGNDAGQVATQTTDTKPEIAVGVGGSSAGVGSSGASKQGVGAAIGAAADAIGGLFSGGNAKDASPAPAKQECKDGSCSDGSCADGSCELGGCEDGSCSE